MRRISIADLQAVCDRINHAAGTPATPYRKNDNGTFSPNASAYYLHGAYGGYALEQMSDCEGRTGCRCVFSGHMPKRDLYNQMLAYARGLEVRPSTYTQED